MDRLRLFRDLIYWNVRKSVFVWRGRQGPAPCQTPGDSGRAWQTGCEASLNWDKRSGFHRVCPFYREGPNGWCCSVDAPQVRPFWGRAAAWYGGTFAAMVLAAGVAIWIFFLAVGVRGLTPLDPLWPGGWRRIAAARSAHFVAQAEQALKEGDPHRSALNLATAIQLAPDSFDPRLMLARLSSHVSRPGATDREFIELWARFPAQRAQTAVIWHDVLLSSRRFGLLARVAFNRMADPQERAKPAWARAVFIALRCADNPRQIVGDNDDSLQALPPPWLEAVHAFATLRDPGGPRAWAQPPVAADTLPLLVVWGEYIANTAGEIAGTDQLLKLEPILGTFESGRLRFRLHLRHGNQRAAMDAFNDMIHNAGRPIERDRMVAALIEDSFAPGLDLLARAAAAPGVPFNLSEAAGVWVAAVLGGNAELRALMERRLDEQELELKSFPVREATPANMLAWMKLLPLSRDHAYALAVRVSARAPGR